MCLSLLLKLFVLLNSLSFQHIYSVISIDIDSRKMRLNWNIFMTKGRMSLLYWADALLNEWFVIFPIQSTNIFFLKVLPKDSHILEVFNSTLVNSCSNLNETHWYCCIIIVNLSLTNFWRIRPHIFNMDINTFSSSRSSLHKLPSLLLGNLY